MTEFDLPDTFHAWFLVTELHVWMLSCRAMKEGPEGKFLRNQLIIFMWQDVQERLKKLKVPIKERNKLLLELGSQFRAGIIMYDEVSFMIS